MTDQKKNSTEEKSLNEDHDPSRRTFVKNTGLVIGGLAGGSLLGGLLTNRLQTKPKAPPAVETEKESKAYTEARMFFTRYEDFVVLEQATERIFPEDENGPGAIELGVPYFIDKQLAGPWGMNAKDYRQGPFQNSVQSIEQSRQTRGEIFLTGLRTMNQVSEKRFTTPFNQADEEQQIEILEDFESGKVDMVGVADIIDAFEITDDLEFTHSDLQAHSAGGVMMGEGPENSAVNNYSQMWEMDNLFVVGASSFPHFGHHNPTGTVGALAYRAAEGMIKYLKEGGGLLVEAKSDKKTV